MKRFILYIIPVIILLSCKSEKDDPQADNDINLFSIEDDKEFGLQTSQYIESDTSGFIILDTAEYYEAYQHLSRITNTILDGGEVKYRDEFVWRTRIIHDDSTLNAFCAPGGYMYVFTGLIHYLDTEDELAGVMGHEIAHADRRHSTDQMTKQYGYDLLLSVLLGDESAIAQVASGLILLSYSRDNESEADEYSVRYLCPTVYNAAGGAGFFEKIEAEGGSSVPEFLSTHPDPGDRIETFYSWQDSLNCDSSNSFTDLYQDFKNSLP